jgi:hypothetical protein
MEVTQSWFTNTLTIGVFQTAVAWLTKPSTYKADSATISILAEIV